jgi:hypothetical protein
MGWGRHDETVTGSTVTAQRNLLMCKSLILLCQVVVCGRRIHEGRDERLNLLAWGFNMRYTWVSGNLSFQVLNIGADDETDCGLRARIN